MERICLDEFGDAELTDDYLVVDNEVAFLKLGLTKNRLMIKGSQLCTWAKRVYLGRQIPFSLAVSPTRKIRECFPFLTLEEATKVKILMKNLPNNWESIEILNAAWPADFWFDPENKNHAAAYLTWLSETENPEIMTKLVGPIASGWSVQAGIYSQAYEATTRNQAEQVLEKWILGNDGNFSALFGKFPLSVNKQWRKKQLEYWKNEITLSYGVFIQDFLRLETPYLDKVIVAEESFAYFLRTPTALTTEIAESVARYLSPFKRNDLFKLIPVSEPSKLPEKVDEVIKWFRTKYIPFRTRAFRVKDNNAWETSIEYGRQFAIWYLDNYQALLSKNKDFTHRRSNNLSEYKETVNLVILLDGLNVVDGENLLVKLMEREHNTKLKLLEDGVSLTVLPTVTEFTKKHILSGGLIYEQTEENSLGVDSSDVRNPKILLQTANPGDIIFWRLKEPDSTYHKENNSDDLEMKVDAAIYGITTRITNLIEPIDPSIRLRVIITTDHGRILGTSKKEMTFPEDFEVHGRASWGKKNIEYGNKGYVIDGNIAYLSKSTFMLEHETAAVIIGQDAFRYGKYQSEVSPHGGVFPEEVIVPWIIFERDVPRPKFNISVSGSAEANKPGQITLKLINPSAYLAFFKVLQLDFGSIKENLTAGFNIEPMRTNEYTFTLERWPSADQKENGGGKLIAALPNGELIETSFDTKALESRSLYNRGNILDGLDL